MIELELLLATFAARTSRHQAGVIAYLVDEKRVLKEQLEAGGKRLRFTDDQRRLRGGLLGYHHRRAT